MKPMTPLLLTPSSQPFDILPSRKFQYFDLKGKAYTGHTDTPMIHVTSGIDVDVLIDNSPSPEFYSFAAHPIHLHGHHFWVLGSGIGTFSLSNETIVSSLNFIDPPFRDTFKVPPKGWILIRFRTSSPGAWSLHCHTVSHSLFGMDRIFIVDRSNWPSIPSNFPRCGKYTSVTGSGTGSGTGTGGGTGSGSGSSGNALGIGGERVMERVLISAVGVLFVCLAFTGLIFSYLTRVNVKGEILDDTL